MGRAGQANDQAESAADQQAQTAELNKVMGYQDTYNADLSKIENGQNIGANPYQNPDYLRSQNMIAATTADAADNADANQLESATRRTGLNSASLGYDTSAMNRQKVSAITDYMAGLNNQNYTNNLNWQQYLLGATLAPAGVANTAAGTATSGLNSANSNLTQLGLASYGPVNSLIQGLGSAVGGWASGGFKTPCWIAAEVFDGWDDPRTQLVRAYLNIEFIKWPIGNLVMAAYRKFGVRVAKMVRKHSIVRWMVAPLFLKAVDKAEVWANEWSRVNAIRKIACRYS